MPRYYQRLTDAIQAVEHARGMAWILLFVLVASGPLTYTTPNRDRNDGHTLKDGADARHPP
jgi:hypothetical protein